MIKPEGAELDTVETYSDSPRNRVTRHLREEILSGNISEGEAMPTERQVADALGVARGTVRAALEILEHEGLIVARKHSKRVVASRGNADQGLLSHTYLLLSSLYEVPDLAPQSGFIGAVETGIFHAGREGGLHSMLLQPNCLDDGYLEIAIRGKPFGILITSSLLNNSEARYKLGKALSDTSVPVIVNSLETINNNCDRVCFDHAAGSEMLTDFLLKQGKARILRVWSTSREAQWLKERNRGHEKCMQQAGLEPLPTVCVEYLPPDRSCLEARARCYAGYLIEHLRSAEPPQAIMVTSDSDVFAVAQACVICGKEPGRDIEIVGYDNNWSNAQERETVSYIPPATVDKHNYAAGLAMVKVLQERRQNPTDETRKVLITPELVIT